VSGKIIRDLPSALSAAIAMGASQGVIQLPGGYYAGDAELPSGYYLEFTGNAYLKGTLSISAGAGVGGARPQRNSSIPLLVTDGGNAE
jgi:hypothetical protein